MYIHTNALHNFNIGDYLIWPISDHQLFFCIIYEMYAKGVKLSKSMETKKFNIKTISTFKSKIGNRNIYNKLDQYKHEY